MNMLFLNANCLLESRSPIMYINNLTTIFSIASSRHEMRAINWYIVIIVGSIPSFWHGKITECSQAFGNTCLVHM